MKLRIKPKTGRGRLQHFDVTACMWPRGRYHREMQKGDIVNQKDFDEVSNYLTDHPNATTFDVALECHFTDKAARYWIKKVRNAN